MDNISLSNAELLKFVIENGMINTTLVLEQVEMQKRKELLEKHPYAIWEGKNGKWFTYLPDEKKGRVPRERKTKEEIENLIVEYQKELAENPSVKEMFYEWLDRKLNNREIGESTYFRYEADFKSYFGDIQHKKIKRIDELDIEDFMKNAVHEHQLSRKAYSGIRTIVYGVFKYAKKKKYIDYNIKEVVSEIEFSRNEFEKTIHENIEQVFFVEEEEKVIQYMKDNLDIVNLGLLLVFNSGVRIGELSTLKPCDISQNLVSIRRTETKYKDRDTGEMVYGVKDHPKTDAGIRDVVLPDSALWILKKIRSINPFGEYLFMENGERIRTYVFRGRLYAICKKCNVVVKSPHKARKTYGTKLYDSPVPRSFICEQMGHTDISCLQKHYYYNRMNHEEKTEWLNKVVHL